MDHQHIIDSNQQQHMISIALNNFAAKCIQDGDYVLATKHLAAAVEYCKSKASKTSTMDFRMRVDECHPKKLHQDMSKNNSCSTVDEWMLQGNATELQSSEDTFFIYAKPIYIPETNEIQAGDDMLVMHSLAITFNLGVAYQLMAMQMMNQQDVDDEELCAAMESMEEESIMWYQYSLKLQTTNFQRISKSPLFYMATINNLGVLYEGMEEYGSSKECFEVLLSMQMHLTSQYGWLLPEFENFFCNTARYIHDSLSVGAGAA